jgi:hypothetical protein
LEVSTPFHIFSLERRKKSKFFLCLFGRGCGGNLFYFFVVFFRGVFRWVLGCCIFAVNDEVMDKAIFGSLVFWVLMWGMVSCVEDVAVPSGYELVREVEPMMSAAEYLAVVGESGSVYDVTDLIEFLAMYGRCEVGVLPAFGNYYQDIGQGGSLVGNLTRVGGERFFEADGSVGVDTTGYGFVWVNGGVDVFVGGNPDIGDVMVCSGVQRLGLRVESPLGARYYREEWAYFGLSSGVDDCLCDGCPCQFCVFYEFWPDVDEFSFMVSPPKYDFNDDGCIDVSDLTVFLSLYGG